MANWQDETCSERASTQDASRARRDSGDFPRDRTTFRPLRPLPRNRSVRVVPVAPSGVASEAAQCHRVDRSATPTSGFGLGGALDGDVPDRVVGRSPPSLPGPKAMRLNATGPAGARFHRRRHVPRTTAREGGRRVCRPNRTLRSADAATFPRQRRNVTLQPALRSRRCPCLAHIRFP